ncbi:uncharacterized protein [Chanodichthys erythropterus]|uniref:uncharacterized protein n=1 Tax=Chanodichthys erythropterus TaxID=933992 RepID=UPI00351E2D84
MLTSDHRSVPPLKVALRLSGPLLDDVCSSLLRFLWSAHFKLQTTVEPSLHRARIRYVLTHSFQSGDWSRDLEGKTPTELEDGPVNFPPVSNNKYYIVSQKKAISTPYNRPCSPHQEQHPSHHRHDTLPRAVFFEMLGGTTEQLPQQHLGHFSFKISATQGYGSSILSHSGQSRSSPVISSSDLLCSLPSSPVPAVQPSGPRMSTGFGLMPQGFCACIPPLDLLIFPGLILVTKLFTWPLTMLTCQPCTEPNFVQ